MDETKSFAIGGLRRRRAGNITLEDGTKHDVLKMKGVQFQGLQSSDTKQMASRTIDAARALVPSLSEAQFADLTVEDCNDIVAIASIGVEAVQEMIAEKNVGGPEIPAKS